MTEPTVTKEQLERRKTFIELLMKCKGPAARRYTPEEMEIVNKFVEKAVGDSKYLTRKQPPPDILEMEAKK